MKYCVLVLLVLVGCTTASVDSTAHLRGPAREKTQTLTEDEDNTPAVDIRRLNFPKEAVNDPVYEQRAVGIFSNPDTPTIGQLLMSARNSIDIEIYEMEDPDIRNILRRKMQEDVKVRVVQEPTPIGKKCILFPEIIAAKAEAEANAKAKAEARAKKTGRALNAKKPKKPYIPTPECLDMRKFLEEVRAQKFEGPKYVAFNKTELCGQQSKQGLCFQHGKMVVIDRRLALISTGNFNSSNLCNLAAIPQPLKCNRDFSYVTRDREVIRALNFIFEKDLMQKRYSDELSALLKTGNLPDKLTVSPYSLDPLVAFIRSANKRIQFAGQYIRPNSGLVEPLLEKARAGADVEVILTDLCYYGGVSQLRAKDDSLMFAEMEKAGIKLKMFTSEKTIHNLPGYMHAKAIVVDGQDPQLARAWVGSVNGSAPSLNQNREFGIFFSNFQRVRALSEFIGDDFKDPTLLSWRESISCHSQKRFKAVKVQKEDEDDEDENETE